MASSQAAVELLVLLKYPFHSSLKVSRLLRQQIPYGHRSQLRLGHLQPRGGFSQGLV